MTLYRGIKRGAPAQFDPCYAEGMPGNDDCIFCSTEPQTASAWSRPGRLIEVLQVPRFLVHGCEDEGMRFLTLRRSELGDETPHIQGMTVKMSAAPLSVASLLPYTPESMAKLQDVSDAMRVAGLPFIYDQPGMPRSAILQQGLTELARQQGIERVLVPGIEYFR